MAFQVDSAARGSSPPAAPRLLFAAPPWQWAQDGSVARALPIGSVAEATLRAPSSPLPGLTAARAESEVKQEQAATGEVVKEPIAWPDKRVFFGFLTLWTWPWLVGSLYSWTRKLRPIFHHIPVVEFLVYLSTGLMLISLSSMSVNKEAGQASKRVLMTVFQWLGQRKWFAEMLTRAAFSFMAGASRAVLLFVGVNLCVNALPENWVGHMPAFVPEYLRSRAAHHGRLTSSDVELWTFHWTKRILFAFLSSLVGFCFLRFKQPPETRVPEEEGLQWVRDYSSESWQAPSFASLVYARQHPQDKRVKHLLQRVALPERVLDVAAFFGLVVLPWTYLFGFRLQTVLAIGGVGGLAVGLAAQNLVGNLIAGVLINLNRPFGEGDEIEAGQELRGAVVDVGFTTTRINRTDGVRTTVPNSRILDGVVVNRSIKDFRAVQETVPVVAPNLSELDALVERIQAILNAHPDVLQPADIHKLKVRTGGKVVLYKPICVFKGYGRYGAELYVQAYMRGTLSNPDFLLAKSDLLLQVNRCVLDSGLSIGFGCNYRVPEVPGASCAPVEEED